MLCLLYDPRTEPARTSGVLTAEGRESARNGRSWCPWPRPDCGSENGRSDNVPETVTSDSIRSLVAARPGVRQNVAQTSPPIASKILPASRRLCTDGLMQMVRGTDRRICWAYFGIDRSLFVETVIYSPLSLASWISLGVIGRQLAMVLVQDCASTRILARYQSGI